MYVSKSERDQSEMKSNKMNFLLCFSLDFIMPFTDAIFTLRKHPLAPRRRPPRQFPCEARGVFAGDDDRKGEQVINGRGSHGGACMQHVAQNQEKLLPFRRTHFGVPFLK